MTGRHELPPDLAEQPNRVAGADRPRPAGPDRRRVLGLAAAVGGLGLVAACSASSDDGDTAAEPSTASESDAGSSSESAPESSSAGAGGDALVATSKVRLRAGVVLDGPKIVVTQPAKGEFKAFTAVCTHQACLVDTVEDNVIQCPCHGSRYSAEDGSVENGPAPAALEEVPVKVEGDSVVRA